MLEVLNHGDQRSPSKFSKVFENLKLSVYIHSNQVQDLFSHNIFLDVLTIMTNPLHAASYLVHSFHYKNNLPPEMK